MTRRRGTTSPGICTTISVAWLVYALEGRVAVVTGASSGIGRATALELARNGARVALAGRRGDLLAQVAVEIERLGGSALAISTDVTSREAVGNLVQSTLDRWGRIDVVIACAGQYIRSPVSELTAEDVSRSLEVNFFGVLHVVLAALPHMLERGSGHIVLMGSLDGRKALPLDAPYVIAKFALSGFGDVARLELARHGVGVTTVYPGRVDTPLVANLRFPFVSPKFPPEKVAKAVLRGIRRDRPEVVVPSYYRVLIVLHTVAPSLTNWAVRRLKLEGWTA